MMRKQPWSRSADVEDRSDAPDRPDVEPEKVHPGGKKGSRVVGSVPDQFVPARLLARRNETPHQAARKIVDHQIYRSGRFDRVAAKTSWQLWIDMHPWTALAAGAAAACALRALLAPRPR